MTKDSAKPATKKDLQVVKKSLRGEIQAVKTDLQQEIQIVKKDLQQEIRAVKTDLTSFKTWVLDNMYTKQDHEQFLEENRKMHNEYLTRMDEVMTELRDAREERKLWSRQFSHVDDTVADHEKRIRVLEKTRR